MLQIDEIKARLNVAGTNITLSHSMEYKEIESCSWIRSTEKVASAEEKIPINGS